MYVCIDVLMYVSTHTHTIRSRSDGTDTYGHPSKLTGLFSGSRRPSSGGSKDCKASFGDSHKLSFSRRLSGDVSFASSPPLLMPPRSNGQCSGERGGRGRGRETEKRG